MLVFRDRNFADLTISLDGGDWQNCTFTRCRLSYAGGPLMLGDGCSFVGSDFVPVGPASMALTLAKRIPIAEGEQITPYVSLEELHAAADREGAAR